MTKSLMIIAGEVSGDMHAARIVEALKEQDPSLDCWGIGGDRLEACGVQIEYHVRDMAVMGLTEVLKRYRFFKRVLGEMIQQAEEKKPDAVLLVDYPGFNLRLAEKLHEQGLKVLYYISPQVWAWHQSRIPKMAKILDHLMVIFPFEVDVFSETDLRVDFVGHPLVEAAEKVRQSPLVDLPWQGEQRVALLPGSRSHEIHRILPSMIETAILLQEKEEGVSFIIAAASTEVQTIIERELALCSRRPSQVHVVAGETRQILRQARCAMVASGTATIETALQRCPMIVLYKTAWLTYVLARMLVRGVDNIGMVNVVAGNTLCPEFIQQAMKPEAMAESLFPLLHDSPEREKMINGLEDVAVSLSQHEGTNSAAMIVLRELNMVRDKISCDR